MPAGLRKILIAALSAFIVVFIYMFFDPSLRDFLYAMLFSIYLIIFKTVVKFAFLDSVISLATIAWKRLFLVGGFALFKRFWINFFKKNAVEHVAKPLLPHTKKWLAVHFDIFKKQPKWIQFSETTFGVAILGGIGYLFGAISYIWTIIEKVLTGKFQSFFLSILGMVTSVFSFVWDKVKPWVDVIIITWLINMVEKIPVIKSIFHHTKNAKVKVVEHKDRAIHAVVHKPVQSMAAMIERHADQKLQRDNIQL